LSGCLGKAKRRGLIPSNPVRELSADERPKQNGREKRILTEKEIEDVLAGASERFCVPIVVMLFAGLRLGETLALRWSDVDFGEGFLRIHHQLSPLRELVELKTKSGRRDVVLIPQLARMLKRHRLASPFKAPGVTFSFLPRTAAGATSARRLAVSRERSTLRGSTAKGSARTTSGTHTRACSSSA
jgi:integrase